MNLKKYLKRAAEVVSDAKCDRANCTALFIAEWLWMSISEILLHEENPKVYDTEEYNSISFEYNS